MHAATSEIVEFQSRRPPFVEEKPPVELINYDASTVTPVFYGGMHTKLDHIDMPSSGEYDASVSHPACVGYTFVKDAPPRPPTPEVAQPDRKKCEYNQLCRSYGYFTMMLCPKCFSTVPYRRFANKIPTAGIQVSVR